MDIPGGGLGYDGGAKLVAYNETQTPRQMTLRERLESQRRTLEAQLSNVKAALACLDEHPDIDKVLEILGRV